MNTTLFKRLSVPKGLGLLARRLAPWRQLGFFWQRRWRWRGRLLDGKHPSQPSKLFRGLTPLVAKVRPRRPATPRSCRQGLCGELVALNPVRAFEERVQLGLRRPHRHMMMLSTTQEPRWVS